MSDSVRVKISNTHFILGYMSNFSLYRTFAFWVHGGRENRGRAKRSGICAVWV